MLPGYSEPFLNADDTALIISHNNFEALGKTYIATSIVKQYSQENDLVLNKGKTQRLFVGPGKSTAYEMLLVLADHEVKKTRDCRLHWIVTYLILD